MRPLHLFFAFFIIPCSLFAQDPKGFVPKTTPKPLTGITRALVVGISNYQYIDKLHYADKDAEVFRDYLLNKSSWDIDKENIILRMNQDAKRGDIITELQRLAFLSKPGDRLIFYFSGHGDTETFTKKGYLLTYDTFSNNYMAGALSINDLKDIFGILTHDSVSLIVITDACRAGNLAGGRQGIEYTAQALQAMWYNEIKILSSQPNEESLEGQQWGNGRGIFSYYLVNGLTGAADADKDSLITIAELNAYFGQTVVKETKNKQQPTVRGPNEYTNVIANLKKKPVSPTGKPAGNNAISFPRFFIPIDSCEFFYRQMNSAIDAKNFESSDPLSATSSYRKLRTCTIDSGFILNANAKLLAALMNTAQEIVNNSFVGKNLVPAEKFEEGIDLYNQAIQNNDLRLPYMDRWKNLTRYLLVQGNATWYEESANKIPLTKLMLIIDSALKEEPEAAYLMTAKAIVEMRKENWQKAIQLLENAMKESPGWLIPKYQLGICYSQAKSYSKALDYYDEVLKKDTTYKTFECTKCMLGKMAEWAWEMKKYKKGAGYYLLSVEHFPDYPPAYGALYDYLLDKKDSVIARKFTSLLRRYDDTATMRLLRIRFEYEFYGNSLREALPAVKPLLKDNYDTADYYYTMGMLYQYEEPDDDSLIFYYTKAIELDPLETDYLRTLVEWQSDNGDTEGAQELLAEKLEAYPVEDKLQLKFILATLYLKTDSLKDALDLLVELKDAGAYTCADLKSMKKTFSKLPAYNDYMKTCKETPQK